MKNIYFQPTKENVNDLYYDAMELLDGNRSDIKKAEKLLNRALEIDAHNAQTHIGFVHVYGSMKNKNKAEEHIQKAYDETLRKFSAWPRRMEWGDMDNRAYMIGAEEKTGPNQRQHYFRRETD